MPYIYILITITGAVTGQLLLKKGLLTIGHSPQNLNEIIPFFFRALTNGYVILAIFVWLIAAVSWVIAVSKGELGHILPFMGLTFALVALLSTVFFKETIALAGWIGIVLICTGVFLILRS